MRWTLAKVGCKELCQSALHHAQNSGAKFARLQGRNHFVKWLSQSTRQFVLFTDSCEARGCIQVIDRVVEKRPLFTAIFCDCVKGHDRVQRWVSRLPDRTDPIHVFADLASMELVVPSLLLHVPLALNKSVVQLTYDDIQASPMSLLIEPTMNDVQRQPMKKSKQLTKALVIQPLMNDVQASGMSLSIPQGKNSMQQHYVSQHAVPQFLELTLPPAGVPTLNVPQQIQPRKQDEKVCGVRQHTKLESEEFHARQTSWIHEGKVVDNVCI